MIDRDLQSLLGSILDDLDEVDGESDEDEARLRRVRREVQGLLEGTGEGAPVLSERGLEGLADAVAQWETRHPRLTQALQQVVDLLSDMGI